ncbi:hypothetical protein [Allomuricauda sp. SCSIO 65647]|uniref:hypothetical protein n=1 Tax=Allomuricauda sp. SCSIO 65647 TaxID=2908843 RepID=UPI001F2CFA4F|nr:hypothetical protein [Muricauda sp. SCSIO 65647]UJH67869.1 hypothetical protein L0P89_01295 [Muricauda sp. SCSIO 65647]
MPDFEQRLKGGHPNSLGNTVELVDEVLADHGLFDELFHCYFSEDEVVRLRVSNAMKRICKAKKDLLLPYLDRFLDDIANIDQASTQWTLAQLFLLLENDMAKAQMAKAKTLLKHNLAHHNDWIVLNQTMDTLAKWAKKDEELQKWLIPHLERLTNDNRKSVSKKALKVLASVSR